MEKILITGTGRCGTTFLIKMFSFLEFNTGYDRNNYKSHVSNNCNAGMEKHYSAKYNVIKNPSFMEQIEDIAKDPSIKIKNVIIPIRDLNAAAQSRVKHGKRHGGLWGAKDEVSQINFYKNLITNYIIISTKYDINTIFIDFDKMIKNKKYLYNKLKNILDEKNINFERFCDIYEISQS